MLVNLVSAFFSSNDTEIPESARPQFCHGVQEDDIDLQLRSLLYCYTRLNIEKLSPFYPVDSNPQTGEQLGDGSVVLDEVYNLERFKSMLREDPHRILVDWCKNKARLVCILSENPIRSHTPLPKDFPFLVLKPDSSEDVYVKRLVLESKLYQEHDIPLTWKIQCLQDIIKKQYSVLPTKRQVFNKQDRWQIMIKYLSKLAERVQIERVYKAYSTQNLSSRRLSNTSDPGNDTLRVSEKPLSTPSTPNRGLRSKPSMTILRLDNSVRSRMSPSLTGSPTRNAPNSPALQSRSPSPKKQSNRFTNANLFSTTPDHSANNSPLYQQSRSCVVKRLQREKRAILAETGKTFIAL